MNSTEQLIFRPARSADLPTLREFEQGVISAERPYASNLIDGHIQYYDLDAMLNHDDAQLLVAEQNGELIASGYARLETDKPYFTPGRYAYLGFMYVVPSARGRGVIQALITELKAWAQSRGITAMKLDVYADNAAAIKAYQKLGFHSEMIEMIWSA